MELVKTHTVKNYEIKFNECELRDLKRALEKYVCQFNPWEMNTVVNFIEVIIDLGIK